MTDTGNRHLPKPSAHPSWDGKTWTRARWRCWRRWSARLRHASAVRRDFWR